MTTGRRRPKGVVRRDTDKHWARTLNYIMTTEQVGIVIVVAGTVLLALSVKVNRQYRGQLGKMVDNLKKKDSDFIEPSETRIVRPMFWSGLLLVAIGSILQW